MSFDEYRTQKIEVPGLTRRRRQLDETAEFKFGPDGRPYRARHHEPGEETTDLTPRLADPGVRTVALTPERLAAAAAPLLADRPAAVVEPAPREPGVVTVRLARATTSTRLMRWVRSNVGRFRP